MEKMIKYRQRTADVLNNTLYAYMILCFYGLNLFVKYTLGRSNSLLSISLYGLLALKIICTDYDKREIVISAALLAVSAMSCIASKDMTWVFNVLVVISMKDVKVDDILKGMFWMALLGFAMVTISSLLGKGDIAILEKDYGRGGVEARYCLGYGHPNQLHLYFFRVVLLGVGAYFDRIKWPHMVIIFMLNLLLYGLTASRTGTLMGMALVAIWFWYHYLPNFVKSRGWKICLFIGVTAMVLFPFVYGFLYENSEILQQVNQWMTGRLQLGMQALSQFPITLWGNDSELNYGYSVDMGGLHILLYNGVVISVLYWTGILLCLWKGLKENRTYMIMVVVLFVLYSLSEFSAIERIGRNISMLYLSEIVFYRKMGKNRSKNSPIFFAKDRV
jgi:hypothetical protein